MRALDTSILALDLSCAFMCCWSGKEARLVQALTVPNLLLCVQGCGLITYKDRNSAAAAIQQLHGEYTFPGSDCPMVVEWMDLKKQRPAGTACTTAASACTACFCCLSVFAA